MMIMTTTIMMTMMTMEVVESVPKVNPPEKHRGALRRHEQSRVRFAAGILSIVDIHAGGYLERFLA